MKAQRMLLDGSRNSHVAKGGHQEGNAVTAFALPRIRS
jgi:hypothetical protein